MAKILNYAWRLVLLVVGLSMLAASLAGSYFFGTWILYCSTYFRDLNNMELGNLSYGVSDFLLAALAAIVSITITNIGGFTSGLLVAGGCGFGQPVRDFYRDSTETWFSKTVTCGLIVAIAFSEITAAVFFFTFFGHHTMVALFGTGPGLFSFAFALNSAREIANKQGHDAKPSRST